MQKLKKMITFSTLAFSISSTNANTSSSVDINDLRIAVDLSNAVFCEEDYGDSCIKEYGFLGRSKSPEKVNVFIGNNVKSSIESNKKIIDETPKASDLSPLMGELRKIDRSKDLKGANDSFQAFGIYDSTTNTAFVTIRGSVSILNWLMDATIVSEQFRNDPKVRVHSGFNHHLKSMLATKAVDITTGEKQPETLQQWLDRMKLEHGDLHYVFTGLSLGATSAVLLGATMIDQGVSPDHIKVITFGQPAVGLWGFVSKYQPLLQDNYIRVRNIGNPEKVFGSFYPATIGDPIIVSTGPFNYHHFGKELIVSEDKYHYFADTLPDWIPEQFKYLLSLHNRTNYADFICSCNPLRETCDTVTDGNMLFDLTRFKPNCKLEY
ncbi:hypothetical protein LO80_00980 [Candidatus Francisella endociliophora]|uniref:Fungal lipase-type domain-containing protein n=1 Tax=Candidatus Francisella endociliophora TaxID=653937 RepID=A0A097EM89_9GAMM|nr:lipase family protein [Francisella sp. FSC1006]AIT08687.1 hypothetical protein LO80_00980 [Francisella sp. FSC1006]